MATPVNDRDVLIMGTSPRYTAPSNSGMYVTPSTAIFKTASDGSNPLPSSFSFQANLLNLTGTVAWSWTTGLAPVVTGNSIALDASKMSVANGSITATITVDGQQYISTATVSKVADGAAGTPGTPGVGTPGARGAGHWYTAGNSWSDTLASKACPGGPVVNDVVTISNNSTFVNEKYWDGSAWQQQGIVLNGQLIVPGSITANLINANGLSIRDTSGNVILDAGRSLSNQVGANRNLVAAMSSWKGAKTGNPQAYTFFDSTFMPPAGATPAQNCEYGVLPAIGNSGQLAIIMGDPLPIPTGTWYTISFWVWNQGSSAGAMASDVYYYDGNNNNTVDTAGTGVNVPPNGVKFVTYTEQMPSNPTQKAFVRFLSGDQNNQFLFWNVKVELGKVATPWCDSVITKANASTYMSSAAIALAYIDTASIGTLSALAAYMDSIHVNGGGGLSGGDYTGYAWPGASGKKGFYIGPPGLLLGNPTDGKFFQVESNGNIYGANWSVVNGVPSFTNPVMTAPTVSNQVITDSYTATISGSAGGSYPNGSYSYGTLTANPSGGRAPYKYSWSLSPYANSGNVNRSMTITDPTAQSVSFGGAGTNATLDYRVVCVVTDANGRTLTLNTEIVANHGTPP